MIDLKKAILTFTLSLMIYNLWGQDGKSVTNHRKVELEVTAVAAGPGSYLTPAVGYGTDKHSVYIAPLLSFYEIDEYGLMSGYKFYPNARKNRANLFFSYNISFVEIVHLNLYNDKFLNYYLENTIGYGFDLRLIEEFYLTTEIGVGFQKRWNSYYDLDNRTLSTWIIKLGLKKRFRKK